MLTATVKIDQSEGIPDSGIPERVIVKKFYRRSFRPLFPIPPLFFLAFFRVALPVLSRRCYYLNAWNRLFCCILKCFRIWVWRLCYLKRAKISMPGFFLTNDKGKSSTWRELKAVYYTLLSVGNSLKKHKVQWHTDNQNVTCIINRGSTKPDLQTLVE